MTENSLLSRENSQVLRGMAILFIILHNLLHNPVFGLSKENEMSYSQELSDSFWMAFTSGCNFLAEFFSFLGWTGVPVFVFLTGYGLTKNYPPQARIESKKYLRRNYLKLFFLMLPAVLFFIVGDIEDKEWMRIAKKVFALSMMHNLDYPDLKINPSIYWYFSLTFQYYIVYLLFRRYFNARNLLIFSLFSLIALYALGLGHSEHALSIYKHCFTGWFPVFALGVWCAGEPEVLKYVTTNIPKEMALFFILLILLVAMNMNYVAWLFVPIVALMWFLVAGKFVLRLSWLSDLFKWVGRFSAIAFVCHPIARTFFLRFHMEKLNLLIAIVAYFLLILGIGYFYQIVYAFLLKKAKI